MSPPSRAAWIEITSETVETSKTQSPPSRAAWIEIPRRKVADDVCAVVAAFTGGVD